MPGNIDQYNAPTDKLQPSSAGDETIAHMARVDKSNYDEAGRAYDTTLKGIGSQVENYQYMQEVSQGSAALAVMHNNMAMQWNKTAAGTDPNDTSIQQTYMDQANEQLGQWQDGFQTKRGQEWAMSQADGMRNHLWEKTSADMSIRAGKALVGNLTTTLSNLSDAAYKDPTTIDQALSHVDGLVGAIKEGNNGVLPASSIDSMDTMSADMKNEIVKAGMKGLSEKNPQAAMNVLKGGTFDNYLSTQEKQQMQSYAQNQALSKQTDADNKDKVQQQDKAQAAEKANGQYLGNLIQGQVPSASDIISNKDLTPRQKSLWTARDGILSQPLSQLQNPTFGDGFSQASQALYQGRSLTPDGLLFGIHNGDLTPAGAAQLQKMQALAKTPEGLASLNAQKQILPEMKSQIVKGSSDANDPNGVQNYNNFLNAFYTQWDKATSQGVTPAQLTDPKDVNYIGKLAQNFKRSDAQAIADVMKSANTAPPKAAVKNWVIEDGKLVQR